MTAIRLADNVWDSLWDLLPPGRRSFTPEDRSESGLDELNIFDSAFRKSAVPFCRDTSLLQARIRKMKIKATA